MAILTRKSLDKQADLFSLLEPPTKPELRREAVPERLEIATNRFYLVIRQGELCWQAPVQFTEVEIRAVLTGLQKLAISFELDSDGRPYYSGAILDFIESWCDRAVAKEVWA